MVKNKIPENEWIDFILSTSGLDFNLKLSSANEEIGNISAVMRPAEELTGETKLYSFHIRLASGSKGTADCDDFEIILLK